MVNGKKLIALCSSRIYAPEVHGYVSLLSKKLIDADCALLIFTINSDIYWDESAITAETYVFDLMPYDELDCVVIMDEKIKSRTVTERIIGRSKDTGVPVVVVDGHYEGATSVSFDYGRGFEKVVRHVIEEHHAKRPHIMAGLPGNSFSDERIDIFKKVLSENGIAFDESMLSYGHFWADPTREATQRLLEREVLPDAIICANDIMAVNVCDVLKSAGISIPGQVMVSGFDGIDEVYISEPKLTTASCDTALLAGATCEAVLKLIKGENAENAYIVPELSINESCGCPARMLPPQTTLTRLNSSFYRHQDDMRILSSISSHMETSHSLWDMAAAIHCHQTKNSLYVVDLNCFNPEKNYFLVPEDELPPHNLHMIDDADYAEENRFEHLPLQEELFYDETVNNCESVLSGNYRDRIIELSASGYPLIFNALDFMNRPIGFSCFYFHNYTITNYARSATITNAINMGIGGYINLTHQRFLLEKVDSMYKHDALTGLYNRTGFLLALDSMTSAEGFTGTPLTVIMSDLDGLKYINDSFGHAEGDRAIATVASALIASCPDHALCARYGGDELFAVIAGDCDADAIIKAIDSKLDDFNKDSDLPYSVLTSSGAHKLIFDRDFNMEGAMKAADKQMYKVKNKKNRARQTQSHPARN